MAHELADIKLPLSVITIIDLGRLERELNAINEFVIQSAVREVGQQPKLPRISRVVDELAKQNDVNLLIEADRLKLGQKLEDLRNHAPIVHISFANDPPPAFLTKIITWFRNEIHPQIFIQVGLQPSVAAGCTVRTQNKYFDFSLRKYFDAHRQLLIDKLVLRSE